MSDKRINKIVKRFMYKEPFELVDSFKEANYSRSTSRIHE